MTPHEEPVDQGDSTSKSALRKSVDEIISSSSGISNSTSALTGGSQNMIVASQVTDYQEDRYIFRNAGKRFKDHLKKFGEGLHFPGMRSPKTPDEEEADRSQFELELIPADDFEDITRLIWSAFRVPFNAISTSPDGSKSVPVILGLVKVFNCAALFPRLICFRFKFMARRMSLVTTVPIQTLSLNSTMDRL